VTHNLDIFLPILHLWLQCFYALRRCRFGPILTENQLKFMHIKLFEKLHSNEAASTVDSSPAQMSRPVPGPPTTISSSADTSLMESGTHSKKLPASLQLPATANARCDLISCIH
jgi:hypothetical protein